MDFNVSSHPDQSVIPNELGLLEPVEVRQGMGGVWRGGEKVNPRGFREYWISKGRFDLMNYKQSSSNHIMGINILSLDPLQI